MAETERSHSPLQVFIQDLKTGRFLKGEGKWAEREEEANDFRSSVFALDQVECNRMKNVQIVLKFPHSSLEPIILHCKTRE